jgi:hypothetical protein
MFILKFWYFVFAVQGKGKRKAKRGSVREGFDAGNENEEESGYHSDKLNRWYRSRVTVY